MRRIAQLALLALLLPAASFGQAFSSQALSVDGRPLPFSSIIVCSGWSNTLVQNPFQSCNSQVALTSPAAPALTAVSGTNPPAGTYQVVITYTNGVGETIASAPTSITTTGGNLAIQVTSPAAFSNATGWNAYFTVAGGSIFFKQTSSPVGIGTNYTQNAAINTGGANPPTSTTATAAILPLATIYFDTGQTQLLPNPTRADANGRYTFFAPIGQYTVSVSLAGYLTYSYPSAPGGGSGGATPAPPAFVVQMANSGVTGLAASNIQQLGDGTAFVNANARFKGPNPYIDIASFGARPCNVSIAPCAAGVTATTTANSTTATLNSASSFVNGDGLVIYGAGSASGLSTPTAPAITSVLAEMGVETDLTVAGATGSTTKCYKIIARTTGGGYTPASPEACTTTGQSTLGIVTVNLSSCSRSATNVSCTTTSATPLLVGGSGAEVYIGGAAGAIDNSFRGWRATSGAPDSTHFSFADAAVNSLNGAPTGTTGGTATFFVANHLSWTAVSNAWLYYIYCGASGAETLCGVSRPQNRGPANPLAYTTWDDFTNLMQNFTFPPWIPTTPPTLGANNNLSTTIVSGAGTTTLVMQNAATAAVSNAGARLDACPGFVAAAAAASASGVLYVPGGAAAGNDVTNFTINSYCDLTPYQLSIVQNGNITVHETLALAGSGTRYSGSVWTAGGNLGANTWGTFPHFNVFEAVPGLYLANGNSNSIRGVQFQFGVPGNPIANGVLLALSEPGFNGYWEDATFITGSQPTDLAGFGLILRGQATAAVSDTVIERMSLVNGLNNDGISHNTPFFCNNCGTLTIKNMYNIRAGIIFYGNPSGEVLTLDRTHYNGGYTPLISAIAPTATITLGTPGTPILTDTIGHPCLSVFSGGPLVHDNSCAPSGYTFISPPVTGGAALVDLAGSYDNTLSTAYQTEVAGPGSSLIFNATGPNGGISVGYNNDSIFVQGAPVPAPTCTVNAGGSVAIASYQFAVAPIWWNTTAGMYGSNSFLSNVCATTTGNQSITVNWTAAAGNPQFMHVFAIGVPNGGSISGGGTPSIPGSGGGGTAEFPPSVTSAIWSSGGIGAPVALLYPHGGPTTLLPATQGIATPALRVQGMAMGLPLPSTASSSQQLAVSGAQEVTYDNFNRGSLGTNWAQFFGGASIGITGNQAALTAGSVAYAGYTALTFAQDLFAQSVVAVVSTGEAGPGIRQNSANGYFCVETTTALNLIKYFSNLRTQLATSAITGANGDILRIEVQGPNLTCYRNGVSVLTTSDTTIATGVPGLIISDATARLDNWSGGNLHPFAQLDAEEDWTQPQHFVAGITFKGGNSTIVTALQGSDTNLMTSGTVSGTSALLCTDANGGATTSGCPGGSGIFYQTIDQGGTAQTQRPTLNFINGTNMTVSCVDNAGATRTDCTFTSSTTAATAWSAITAGTNANAGTFAATGNTWDWTATTIFKLRTGAGLTTSANGDIGFDTTNTNWHAWNGADRLVGLVTGSPANNDCAKFVLTGNKVELTTNGGACAAFYQTVDSNGTAQTQRPVLNLANGTNVTVSCADNSGAGRTDCIFSSSPATVQVFSSTNVPASLLSNTSTTLAIRNISTPASGCPCRAFISYSLHANYQSITNSFYTNTWVSDGTNTMAGVETGQSNASSGARTSLTYAGYSPVTYGNGTNVTFTLLGLYPVSPGPLVGGSPDQGSGPPDNFQIAIVISN